MALGRGGARGGSQGQRSGSLRRWRAWEWVGVFCVVRIVWGGNGVEDADAFGGGVRIECVSEVKGGLREGEWGGELRFGSDMLSTRTEGNRAHRGPP